MTRVIHKPKAKGGKDPFKELDKPIPPILVEDKDGKDDDPDANNDEPFFSRAWHDYNIGSPSYFRGMTIAGIEITYNGKKDYLTVHLRGEHRFPFPSRGLYHDEITKFALECAFQVITDQINTFQRDAATLNIALKEKP
jgi:hypothetical protein